MVDSFLGQAEEGNKTALLKLQLIGHYIMGGDFSITDLSHEMNLSVPTVTKLVSELIEEGFVHDFGKQGTAGGRRPNIYGLNPYAGYFVGVDIKKDIITLAIINFKGQVVDMRDCVPFVMENSVQALDRLCDVVNGFIAKSKIDRAKIFSVGFNLSGRVNSKTGYSYSYFFVEEEPLTMLLEKRLGCKVYVENDANAAAYGEYIAGGAKGYNDAVVITLGTGIGSGIILGGKILRGFNFAAGEMGHNVIVKDGIQCTCGRRGCWERYASASALTRETKAAMQANKNTIMWKMTQDIDHVNAKLAFDAAAKGDETARKVIDSWIEYVGVGIANVINTFEPEVICIGGGVSNQGEVLLAPVRDYAENETRNITTGKFPVICACQLHNDAGVIGAAALGSSI